jgi:hypothetical protein
MAAVVLDTDNTKGLSHDYEITAPHILGQTSHVDLPVRLACTPSRQTNPISPVSGSKTRVAQKNKPNFPKQTQYPNPACNPPGGLQKDTTGFGHL